MDQSAAPRTTLPPPRRRHRALRITGTIFGVLVIGVVALILLWNWDWFIPIVQNQASAAIGRKVTISHLHVRLGRNTIVAADNVVVANPDGFVSTYPLARIGRLTIVASVMDYINHRTIVLPSIGLDHPDIRAIAMPNGSNNFTLKLAPAKPGAKPSPPPQIGDLQITSGTAYVVDLKIKTNFAASIATRPAAGAEPAAIVVNAKGTYAGQPVTGTSSAAPCSACATPITRILSTCTSPTAQPRPPSWGPSRTR